MGRVKTLEERQNKIMKKKALKRYQKEAKRHQALSKVLDAPYDKEDSKNE